MTYCKDFAPLLSAFVDGELSAAERETVLAHLDEGEADIYRRAHNSGHLNKPKRASGADYRAATGFEAVLGALWHLGETDRARELFRISITEIQEEGQKNDTEG